jgi:hypothetical protein
MCIERLGDQRIQRDCARFALHPDYVTCRGIFSLFRRGLLGQHAARANTRATPDRDALLQARVRIMALINKRD